MALNNVGGTNRRIKIIPFVETAPAQESEESDVISKGDFRNLDYDSGSNECGSDECGGGDCGSDECGGGDCGSDECGGGDCGSGIEDEEDEEDKEDIYFEDYHNTCKNQMQTHQTQNQIVPTPTPRSPQLFKDACEKVYQMWQYQLAAYIVQNKHVPCPVENPALISSYIVSETMYGPLIPRLPNAVMLACKMHDDLYFMRHNIESPFDKIKSEAAVFKVKVTVVGDGLIEYQL